MITVQLRRNPLNDFLKKNQLIITIGLSDYHHAVINLKIKSVLVVSTTFFLDDEESEKQYLKEIVDDVILKVYDKIEKGKVHGEVRRIKLDFSEMWGNINYPILNTERFYITI